MKSSVVHIGDVYGSWKIIDDNVRVISSKDNSYNHYYYKCLCLKCNETISFVRKDYLLHESEYKCCKSCYDKSRGKYLWSDEEERKYFYALRKNAKRRGISFNLKIKYIYDLLKHQNNTCALTGEEILFSNENDKIRPSLDRIDSSLGYINGNVQWVSRKANIFKGEMTKDELLDFCKAIIKYNIDNNNNNNDNR